MSLARIITEKYLASDMLNQSEEKYRSIIQNLQFGLIEVDLDEHILFINDAMCEITGYSREELLGKVASEVLADERTREEIARQHELRADNKSSVYEAEIRRKDGTKLFALISEAPTYHTNQEIKGSIGIHVDISERKQWELELQEKQRFLSAINEFVTSLLDLEDINDIAWEIAENVIHKFGFQDCIIYIWNEKKQVLEQLAANGSKMAQGRKIKNPIEIKLGEGIVGTVAKRGKAELIANTSLDPRYILDDMPRLSELTVPIKADGKVIGVIDSEHPLPNYFTQQHLDTLNTIANLVSTKIKNAKAKRQQEKAEQELRESETKLRQVIESALDAIITINEQGDILEWNLRAEEIFGWNAKEVIGTSLTSNIIPTQYHQAHSKGMQRFNQIGSGPVLNQRIDLTALRKGGQEFPVELTIIPIIQGGTHSFTAFIRDITSAKATRDEMQKALNRERELNELKSQFVAMSSHGFRTPLTTIKQNASLIQYHLESNHPESRDSYTKYFDRIDSEITRVTNLMNDMLFFGKLEAGKTKVNKKLTDLKSLAAEAIAKICMGREDQRSVDLITQGVERTVNVDPELMDLVFTNLISNSLKYSPNATKDPQFILTFNQLSQVTITCRDFGLGIPVHDQKNLFSSFFRATNVKNIPGTGLGLSITQELLELHEAKITFTSEFDEGAEFVIFLPTT